MFLLDLDPSNGDYLYYALKVYYDQENWKKCQLLIDKYLLLNLRNKLKVLTLAIKI